jgi:hypothetical protein
MRRLFFAMAFTAAALIGPAAQAGSLISGMSSLTFVLGDNDPLVFQGDGSSAGTSTNVTNFSLAAGGAFAGATSLMLVPTANQPLMTIKVTIDNNAQGMFTGSPPHGDALISGTAKNYVTTGTPLLKVPISLGITVMDTAMGSGIKVTFSNKQWTAGMSTVDLGGGMTEMITGSVMGGTPGTAKLVAGSKIVTNLGITTFAFGILTLKYDSIPTPEPGLPMLLVAGAATLGVFGWRKRRS